MTEVFILVPALLGLKGNLEMTLASRLSTAVSVLAVGSRGEGQGEGSGQHGDCYASTPLPVPGEEREAVEGDPRLGVLSLGRGSLPRMVPRLRLWMSQPSLDACRTSCFATCLVTVCAALTGQASRWSLQPHRWGPPLISSPTLQLGRSRARPSPHPFEPSPFPVAAYSSRE